MRLIIFLAVLLFGAQIGMPSANAASAPASDSKKELINNFFRKTLGDKEKTPEQQAFEKKLYLMSERWLTNNLSKVLTIVRHPEASHAFYYFCNGRGGIPPAHMPILIPTLWDIVTKINTAPKGYYSDRDYTQAIKLVAEYMRNHQLRDGLAQQVVLLRRLKDAGVPFYWMVLKGLDTTLEPTTMDVLIDLLQTSEKIAGIRGKKLSSIYLALIDLQLRFPNAWFEVMNPARFFIRRRGLTRNNAGLFVTFLNNWVPGNPESELRRGIG